MHPPTNFEEKILSLRHLLSILQKEESYQAKLEILNSLTSVQSFLQQPTPLHAFIKRLTPESEYVIKSVIALDQGPIVFNVRLIDGHTFQRLLQLLEQLLEIEDFYRHLGGIIGYHLTVIELIACQNTPKSAVHKNARYIHPEGLHLGTDDRKVREAVKYGIESIPRIGAIYPLGGAGDRLSLTDEATGDPLPAALLPFLGCTLLEGLIRELQSMEYLYFKLFNEQVLTSIAIMTSVEKNNHIHILNICKKLSWFGRPSDSFYFFIQPVVPVMTVEGNWSLSAPLTLTLKPCGHGVLWKLAEDQNVLSWMESTGREHCLIRQINNPLGGTDHSLLGLIGTGMQGDKNFGFLSCERLLNSDEGTNVLIETKHHNRYEYCLTNIEYTDFVKRGIGEHPSSPQSPYSIYPTNTNILFAKIPAIRECLKTCPIPGQLVNMKHKVSYIDENGEHLQILGGRLESTMQNIADSLVDTFDKKLAKQEYSQLRTFIVYNKRSKTISTTKKLFHRGEAPDGTPDKTYYDLLSNHSELLKTCGFQLPEWGSFDHFLDTGPTYIFLFHPAMGPLFSIISQKIRGGSLSQGSEIQLEIAEADIEMLHVHGSLIVEATSPFGKINDEGVLQYGFESRVSLKNITISNQGIDRDSQQNFWKNELIRKESVKILLHEGAEFHAEGLSIEGNHLFEVPPYHRMVLLPFKDGHWKVQCSPINHPSWSWNYTFDEENRVKITSKNRS